MSKTLMKTWCQLMAWTSAVKLDRRRNIDSRTFTRPKKRMGRPSLELLESLSCLSKPTVAQYPWASGSNEMAVDNLTCTLLESSLLNCSMDNSQTGDINSQLSIVNKKQKVSSQTERRRGSLVLSEVNDDISDDLVLTPKIDNGNTVTAYVENVNYSNLKVSSQQNDVPENMEMHSTLLESTDFSTSLIDSALLDANLMDTIIVNTKPKLSGPKMHQLNRTFTPSPPPVPMVNKDCDQVVGQHQSANENLNNTYRKDEENPNCALLNNTFSLDANESSGSQRNVSSLRRPGSTDSGGADDDQLSSASESSHTSSTRLMSVGDVQHIARLQEQSLVISTPVHRHLAKVIDYAEDISPILRSNGPDCGRSSGSSEIQTGGYLSDHSSRSPMSSLHSSPAGSPFGSSTMLPGSNLAQVQDSRLSYRPNGMLQRKNTYGLIPPPKTKERGLRPPAPSVVPSLSRPTVRSGLRPPMVRTNIPGPGSSGLPRPAGTGIPRPASLSRIPPPKVRSSVPRPSRKEWTDECY
ncbi:uncharacterized protein LOC117644384 isoform X2 [Thrips palmi]|uniref:Uncharacterized protein LOC117644384 isoform X2 n=1 Tax=Thrips palmi TaxID=161013 RepID=A0A6P8YZH0_THRPL|nr:uncharacterized protein LOC117644384 isoform X2 [Thrips palmi]